MKRKTSQKVSDRIIGKHKIHPADKLVEIANALYMTGKPDAMVEAAAIWTNLLKYFEPTKKPVEATPEKTTPEEAREAAEETFKLLREIEENGSNSTASKEPSVADGAVEVPVEASSETNLRGDSGQ